MVEASWLSVLPPIVALGAAVALKQVIVALILGVWTGGMVIHRGKPALSLLRVSGADADEFLLLAALALPVILTNLLGFSHTIIGQILVGHVSAEALASATLANMLCNALGMSVIIGCSSACS